MFSEFVEMEAKEGRTPFPASPARVWKPAQKLCHRYIFAILRASQERSTANSGQDSVSAALHLEIVTCALEGLQVGVDFHGLQLGGTEIGDHVQPQLTGIP